MTRNMELVNQTDSPCQMFHRSTVLGVAEEKLSTDQSDSATELIQLS